MLVVYFFQTDELNLKILILRLFTVPVFRLVYNSIPHTLQEAYVVYLRYSATSPYTSNMAAVTIVH